MKEPLYELFDLYERMVKQPKPELEDGGQPSVSTPQRGDTDHPIIQTKNKVDSLRLSGMSTTDSHEQVHGEVDTSDTMSKAHLAQTLGRTQQDGNKKAVYVDQDAEHKSLLAKDEEMEQQVTKVTDRDLKTSHEKEIPDALEDPSLTRQEEYDYNDDVAYIQKFGKQ